jgi:hypothetical protein
LHTPSSAQEIEVAAVAKRKSALPAPPHAVSQALAGPVAVDALPAVDDHGGFAQREAGTMAIESDQGIAEPLGLRGPGRRCTRKASRGGEKAIEGSKRVAENADVVAAMEAQCKARRSDDAIASGDGEL